jgi:hypothetical protein
MEQVRRIMRPTDVPDTGVPAALRHAPSTPPQEQLFKTALQLFKLILTVLKRRPRHRFLPRPALPRLPTPPLPRNVVPGARPHRLLVSHRLEVEADLGSGAGRGQGCCATCSGPTPTRTSQVRRPAARRGVAHGGGLSRLGFGAGRVFPRSGR